MKKLHIFIPAVILLLVLPLCISCDKSIYNSLFTEIYSVTYDGNGFTAGNPPSGSPFIYNVNDTVTVSGNTGDFRGPLIQDGITQRFIEWNTAADGTGTAYAAGDTFSMGSANITLYAQWTTDLSVITKTGPAGGYVFYEDTGHVFPTWQYMEAAPVNLGKAPSGEEDEHSGAEGTAIGDGLQNTILKTSFNPNPGTCASLCYNYVLNGYNDWFLPSFDEMQAMYDNLYVPVNIAGFLDDAYWSSTEIFWGGFIWDAYYFDFSDGSWYVGGQGSTMYARPARRF